jgi:hypothetical protein
MQSTNQPRNRQDDSDVIHMNEISQEVRILNCVTELIEDSVNYLVCTFGENENGFVTGVLPKDIIEKRYFFILLLEMFSPVNPEMITGINGKANLLMLLQKVSQRPCLNTSQNDTERINRRATEFLTWLDQEFDYSIYSQEIGKNIFVNISRRDILYLVGNRCKHTLVRSNTVLKRLVKKYREAGIDLLVGEEALVIKDIDTWFLDDFCEYHFTRLCELSSNLYHSIIEYVRPVYKKNLRFKDNMPVGYEVPSGLSRSDYISEFYSLMNKVSNPWIPIIKTPEVLTLRQY